jgi:hypothetical protein
VPTRPQRASERERELRFPPLRPHHPPSGGPSRLAKRRSTRVEGDWHIIVAGSRSCPRLRARHRVAGGRCPRSPAAAERLQRSIWPLWVSRRQRSPVKCDANARSRRRSRARSVLVQGRAPLGAPSGRCVRGHYGQRLVLEVASAEIACRRWRLGVSTHRPDDRRAGRLAQRDFEQGCASSSGRPIRTSSRR